MKSFKSFNSSVSLYPENKEKLDAMAKQLGCKPNHLINLLIENATLGEVVRIEPIAILTPDMVTKKVRKATAEQ